MDQDLLQTLESIDFIIILVNMNKIVMWITLQNNVGWDCFKTPILREILKIQNPLLEEHCAFSEVIRLFQ